MGKEHARHYTKERSRKRSKYSPSLRYSCSSERAANRQRTLDPQNVVARPLTGAGRHCHGSCARRSIGQASAPSFLVELAEHVVVPEVLVQEALCTWLVRAR